MSLEAAVLSLVEILTRIEAKMPALNAANAAAPAPAKDKPAKETKPPKGAPTVVPEPAIDDMFGKDDAPAAAAVTFESLETRLREHAKAFGTKMTLDLMKKHGADPVTPKLKTIPENNYEACYVEADTDLKKVKK